MLCCLKIELFCFVQMSSGEESGENGLTVEELNGWLVKDLKAWLKKRGKKISGSKSVLTTRVYKLMNYVASASSSDSSDSSAEDHQASGTSVTPPTSHETVSSWTTVSTEDIPPISEHDVKNYFLYVKNPVSDHARKFSRQLQKARRMYKERYIYMKCKLDILEQYVCMYVFSLI